MTEREIIHTDAREQARFAAQTPDQQIFEVWLNTRETNGHVAAAMRDIAALSDATQREIAGLAAAALLEAQTLKRHLGEHGEQQAGIDYVKRWGGRGTAGILLLVAIIGAINIGFQIAERF